MGPPRGRNRSSLWMLRKYVRIGESDIPKRESECIPLDKYMPMHTHKCKKRFFLHTDAHIFMLWLLEMMDDVYEILLHFADLYLPCITSSGNRWRFSYILAVSWETLKKKKKKKRPNMCCAYRPSSEVYCPNNMAKQMANKALWRSSCFQRQTNDTCLLSSVDCSVMGRVK